MVERTTRAHSFWKTLTSLSLSLTGKTKRFGYVKIVLALLDSIDSNLLVATDLYCCTVLSVIWKDWNRIGKLLLNQHYFP